MTISDKTIEAVEDVVVYELYGKTLHDMIAFGTASYSPATLIPNAVQAAIKALLDSGEVVLAERGDYVHVPTDIGVKLHDRD